MLQRTIVALCLGLDSAAAVVPCDAAAPQMEKPHQIGFLGADSGAYYQQPLSDLRANLRDLSYVEGKNLLIESS